jgi:hypothetical protein
MGKSIIAKNTFKYKSYPDTPPNSPKLSSVAAEEETGNIYKKHILNLNRHVLILMLIEQPDCNEIASTSSSSTEITGRKELI